MAPSTSLSNVLAYASTFLSQVQIPLSSLSNPFSVIDAFSRHSTTASDTTPYIPLTGAPTCPIDGPLSCNNQTEVDSCCFVYPGGRLLLTQFWDEEVHVGGSEEDWTLHGLWPDLCDGSYDQYCGMAPRFENITDILNHYEQDELLGFMNRYWIAKYGGNAHLWAHEYNKHATCINTLAPSCYDDTYAPGLEVVDYFTRAAGLFRMLDTYTALAQRGIVPDASRSYDLAEVQATLEAFSGGRVVLRCGGHGRNVLHEAWYVYFVQGSLQSGEFVPAGDAFHGGEGNCARRIRYLPKKQKAD